MVITIDGPVASGKSTVARALSREIGFYYLYTGLFYRGIAYGLITSYGYDREKLKMPLAKDIEAVVARLEYRYEAGVPHLYYEATEITPFLKTAQIDDFSSLSSADPQVRKAVLERQILVGQQYDVVADGRDMGTVVFPDAPCKFFLTAAVAVRAARWQKDQAMLGNVVSLETATQFITERDTRDIKRTHSPLIPAEDALIVDNSDYSIDETVALMRELIVRRCLGHGGCSCCS